MTDEAPPPDEATPTGVPLPEAAEPEITTKQPLSRAEKLEAKAAKLREAELARAAAPPRPNGAPVLPWIIATVVLVLALAGSVVYAVHEHSRADKASTSLKLDALRASALKTATTVATSFGTYDYQTLTADFDRTRAYLTPTFASDFSKITASIGTLITQDKGQTVGTVQGTGVQSITSTTAVVLVFLDQKVTTAESSTPRLDHNRLKLTLTLQKNKTWLVSNLTLV